MSEVVATAEGKDVTLTDHLNSNPIGELVGNGTSSENGPFVLQDVVTFGCTHILVGAVLSTKNKDALSYMYYTAPVPASNHIRFLDKFSLVYVNLKATFGHVILSR